MMIKNWYDRETSSVNDYVEKQGFSFRKSSRGGYSDEAGYVDGNKAGERINLDPQIKSRGITKLLKGSN